MMAFQEPPLLGKRSSYREVHFLQDIFTSTGGISTSALLNVQTAQPVKDAPRTKHVEAIIDSGYITSHASIGRFIGPDVAPRYNFHCRQVPGKCGSL